MKNNRIGTINKNNFGSLMEVTEYRGAKDITVKFIEHGNLVHTAWNEFVKGKVKNPYDKSINGIGYIGEGKHKPTFNRKATKCYTAWNGMFKRCYDLNFHEKQPTYKGCIVLEEWHNFQTFADWYYKNYYTIEGEEMHLDKDILIKGNKIYSSDSCIFVPKRINSLFVKIKATRGDLPIGVYFDKNRNKYIAQCNIGKESHVNIGGYDSPEEAFNAYKEFKEKLIKQIANEYKNIIPSKLYEAMINYQIEITD